MNFARIGILQLLIASALTTAAMPDDSSATQDEIQTAIDVAFGAAFTSNYMSKGSTQTQGRPALQGYIEVGYGIVYGGVWASNVRFGGVNDVEIDYYAGIRPEFGKFSFDFGYSHYDYVKDDAVYGEFYGHAEYAVTDELTIGTKYYYEPWADQHWGAAKAEFGGLPYELAVSGSVGTDFGTRNFGKDKYAWDIGLSRSFYDMFTADVRYYDSNLDPARIVGSISFDTTLADILAKGN